MISKVIGTLSLNESVVDKLGQMCISRDLWHLSAFECEDCKELNYCLQFDAVFPSHLFNKLIAGNHFVVKLENAWM